MPMIRTECLETAKTSIQTYNGQSLPAVAATQLTQAVAVVALAEAVNNVARVLEAMPVGDPR